MGTPHKLFYGELRLGNLVTNQRSELGRIVELSLIGVTIRDVRFDFRAICKRFPLDDNPNIVLTNENGDMFTGIPLTSAWLCAMGFDRHNDELHVHPNGMSVKLSGTLTFYEDDCFYYVHELQNKFFNIYREDCDINF